MQNTLFLALLKPFFALKTKIAPLPMVFGMRIGQEPDVIWTGKNGFQPGGKPFFVWRSPKFGQKNRLNFGEGLFFGDHLNLDLKTDSI